MRLSSYRDSIPDRPAVRPAAGNRGGWGGPGTSRGHRSECRRSLCRAVVFLVCRTWVPCMRRPGDQARRRRAATSHIDTASPTLEFVRLWCRNTQPLRFPTVRLAAPRGARKWLSPGQTGGMTAPGRRRCGEPGCVIRGGNSAFEARYPNQPGRVQECFGVSDRRALTRVATLRGDCPARYWCPSAQRG